MTRMHPSLGNSSHSNSPLHVSTSDTLEQPFLQFPVTTVMQQNSWSTITGNRDSSFTSLGKPPTEFDATLDSWNVFSTKPNGPSYCRSTAQNFHDSTAFSDQSDGLGAFSHTKETCEHISDDPIVQDFMVHEEFFKSYSEDEFSQWFASSPDHSNVRPVSGSNDDLFSQEMGFDHPNVLVNHSTGSIQSSHANRSNYEGDNCLEAIRIENSLFLSKPGDSEDICMPVITEENFDSQNYNLECEPKQQIIDNLFSWEGLVSKTGIGDLSSSVAGLSNIGSLGKRRTGNPVTQTVISPESAKDNMRKTKRTRASIRPQYRQRQLDHEAELREMIPNGSKMTIERLYERTIQYMLFLESMIKHGTRLKQVGASKGSVSPAGRFGNQTMDCPLTVQDLSTPGQMLIEMVNEEQELFLEIVDIVQGIGLTILKGMMEVREDKTWAHFIVEAEGNIHVTREETFSALVPHLTALRDQNYFGS